MGESTFFESDRRDRFEVAFNELLRIEGVYSNNAYDRGGETKYGITKETALENDYDGPMKDLPFQLAKRIYKKDYWKPLRCSEISIRSKRLAFDVFEAGVNCGIERSAKWLQKSINVLFGQPLIVDGIIGTKTIEALRYLSRDELNRCTLVKLFNTFQANHYLKIIERDPTQHRFIRGWFKRVKY